MLDSQKNTNEQELKDLVFRGVFIVVLIYILVYAYNNGFFNNVSYNLQTRLKKQQPANLINTTQPNQPINEFNNDFKQPESTQSYEENYFQENQNQIE